MLAMVVPVITLTTTDAPTEVLLVLSAPEPAMFCDWMRFTASTLRPPVEVSFAPVPTVACVSLLWTSTATEPATLVS